MDFDTNNSLVTQENKPYNLVSTTNEIQNVFKKIREKNSKIEKNKYKAEYEAINTNDPIITNKSNSLINSKDNSNPKNNWAILINAISFTSFYFSFLLIKKINSATSYFIYPMSILQYFLVSLSAIITSGFIFLIILKKLPGYHLYYMMIYYLAIFFLFHNKYIGSSHFDQSFSFYYQFISIIIQFLCVFFCFYFLFKYLYYKGNISKENMFIKIFITRWNSVDKIKRSEHEEMLNERDLNFEFLDKKRNITRSIIITLCLLFFQIFILVLLKLKKNKIFTCENIDIGINGTRILYKENIKNQCYIKKPKGYCYMDFFKNYFDKTSTNNLNCSLRDSTKEKKLFLKNLENNNEQINYYTAKKFAFPHTNLYSKYFLKNQKDVCTFGTLVNKDIYDLDEKKNKEKFKIEPEVILDFSDDNIYKGKYGELKMNLVYNKTLAEERKKLENNYSLYDNIFMIYVDATSRAHFQRSFPKLSSLIKNFMSYDESNMKKVDAYQFMKYNSFAGQTPYNIVPMFYGNSYKSKEGVNHIKYFKENGYITGHEVDMCNKEQYDISYDSEDHREYVEWDHENIAYLCDGNYFELDDPYPGNRGAFYTMERCLYGNPVSYYMIEYAKQFWEKYENNKKYFRMAFNYGHEKTGAVISKLDEPLYNFIFDFYDKGCFDNTALFIVSDHGNQNTGIYNRINFDQFEYEKKMGTFFLLLSKNNDIDKYKNNLMNNQQIFLTPYDIHDSIIHLIYGKSMYPDNMRKMLSKNNKGNSVLNMINEEERICNKYDDWEDIKFCCCN